MKTENEIYGKAQRAMRSRALVDDRTPLDAEALDDTQDFVEPASSLTPHEKLLAIRNDLAAELIERDEEIDLLLAAAVAGEHLLLIGPPGLGKSMLLDAFLARLDAPGGCFSWLMNKFTTPEEIFGPVSVQGLKADRFYRITSGKLPEAAVAFLDEIFKASSAILNTMLKMLNEGIYEDGNGRTKTLLKLCVAASNEWPQAESAKELSALFDRFLIRKVVRPLSPAGREKLLWGAATSSITTKITAQELSFAATESTRVGWSSAAKDALATILADLAKEGISLGDRRIKKGVRFVQASAWLRYGVGQLIAAEDLEPLQHVLWDDPSEQADKARQIVCRIANPVGSEVSSLLAEAQQIITGCDSSKLEQAAAATSKLSEIGKKLVGLQASNPLNARLKKAVDYVRAEVSRIKLASVGGF